MVFRNELTWVHATKQGRQSDFHARYEKAVATVMEEIRRPAIHENIIGGKGTKDKPTVPKASPGHRDLVLGLFQQGSAEDVSKAMAIAKAAYGLWSMTDYVERVRVFERAVELFQREKFELAAALTLDNGKNRYEALADIDEAIDFMSYYAGQMRLNDGFEEMLPPAYEDERAVSRLRPYGVWAVICPFNFPVAISIGMSSAALLTGNTVVMKPSSTAPFALHRAFRLLERAGLPPGVANYVAGSGREVGAALTSHPDTEGIVFTGSKAVGFDIMRSAVRSHPIPVIAEMGSKNPVIVTKNADIQAAAEGVVASAFGYGGQKCSACSRLYAQTDVIDELHARIVRLAEGLFVKDPVEKDCTYGPLIEERKVQEYVAEAQLGAKDGKLLTGGRRLDQGRMAMGNYVPPMVISGLPQGHELMSRELFMPVLCTHPFESLGEAMSLANSSPYGLTAGIFTQDKGEMEAFFDGIHSGVVYSNRKRGACTGAMVGAQSFVGWKASGSTGKGTGGPYYLQQFMREQTRTMAW